MGPLRNPKHEKYVQLLFEGQPQNAAYEGAGYSFHEGNASRLRRNEKVIARLSELQSEAAKSSKVTVASLLGELEEARLKATSLKQFSAVVRSIESKARISGLLTEKIEVKQTIEEKFDHCQSLDDIVETMVGLWKDDILEEDREEFRRLTRAWWERFEDFQRAARAKPVQSRMSPEERDRHERRRLGLAQRPLINGSAKTV